MRHVCVAVIQTLSETMNLEIIVLKYCSEVRKMEAYEFGTDHERQILLIPGTEDMLPYIDILRENP